MPYKPAAPFTTPAKILKPTVSNSYGVNGKTFSEPSKSDDIFISFRTFGGTESLKNDLWTVIDTAVIDTWYRPDITSDCRIYLCETGEVFEVIGDPEDIDRRHQYLKFKVKKVGGKV
jgi:SPP1 family predicted phage head-tail adaptor